MITRIAVATLVAALIVLGLLPALGRSQDFPPIEQGIATAVALRGLPIQETPTSPPPVIVVVPPEPMVWFAPAGLTGCDEMRWYRINAGLPSRFDQIGQRESNCRNEDGVRTSCCFGYWQLYVAVHLRDHRIATRYAACGIYSAHDVNSDTPVDKWRQACGAKAVFDVVGYSAW